MFGWLLSATLSRVVGDNIDPPRYTKTKQGGGGARDTTTSSSVGGGLHTHTHGERSPGRARNNAPARDLQDCRGTRWEVLFPRTALGCSRSTPGETRGSKGCCPSQPLRSERGIGTRRGRGCGAHSFSLRERCSKGSCRYHFFNNKQGHLIPGT